MKSTITHDPLDHFIIICSHCGSTHCSVIIHDYGEDGTSVFVKCKDCNKEEYI
jgi:hypothetical protein